MRPSITIVSAPAYEPVSIDEAKRWLRLEDDSNANTTAIVTMLLKAMRERAEVITGRAFVSRQLKLTLDEWPFVDQHGIKIVLPRPPLISVDAFKYIDTDGVLQTLATDQYVVHTVYEPGFIVPAWEVSWPSIRSVPNGLQITYTAGYAPGSPSDAGSNQEVQPAALKLWMETMIATHNEFREQIVAGSAIQQIPRDFCDGLLDGLVIGSRLFE